MILTKGGKNEKTAFGLPGQADDEEKEDENGPTKEGGGGQPAVVFARPETRHVTVIIKGGLTGAGGRGGESVFPSLDGFRHVKMIRQTYVKRTIYLSW